MLWWRGLILQKWERFIEMESSFAPTKAVYNCGDTRDCEQLHMWLFTCVALLYASKLWSTPFSTTTYDLLIEPP